MSLMDGIAGSPRVICVGLSALDHIWRVAELPHGGGKVRACAFAMMGGGMAATAAVTVARLGGEAVFWGRAGADPSGEAMRAALAAEGVDVANFRLVPGAQSSVSSVLVDDSGERSIANFRGAALPEDAQWLPLDALSADAVLADPRWVEGAAAAFGAARAAGIPTVLDADVAERAVFERLLPLTDHAVFSEPALATFARTGDPVSEASRFGPAVTAVTRGALGVDWCEDGALRHQNAFAVAVVDTTGAGDVFHGAYAFAIAAGGGVDEAMAFASAVAALKCTKPGGRDGIPTLDETLAFWRKPT